ncbi:hypothetical protein DV737_g4185, partial [Chaetothyriales sp. CBS 132003]
MVSRKKAVCSASLHGGPNTIPIVSTSIHPPAYVMAQSASAAERCSAARLFKQFIRNVRASKTIADERAVVQKESAAIRASFREEPHDSNVRRANVAKLLYLFTLGERTHFGQIECLKLLASPRFADKRLGYLGTMLLLDENQEVLTLVTNSLQNDLKHANQYVVGLALCTLGNIAGVEMSRDLFPDVETLISTANPYIRRKAALCAMRICRKVPDLQEHFVDKAKLLLSDRNHGVLLCGLTLLVRVLKNLQSSGYTPEHDVAGITDPFLQVKVLRLLRLLGRGHGGVSEQINDILAQVATNTESSKNVGNAILYEAVLTILDIKADSGLRVLGVNILGKFLANKDNNIRYVALNTLLKVVAIEPNAVQRHRNTILDCLRDPDISIRRRALDLSFTLVREDNVRTLIRELLAFLEVADNEFKSVMTTQIGIAADRYAISKRWHIDTMLRVVKLAGNYVKEQILSSFIRLIATSPDQQTYAVQRLYAALKADITQEALTLAGTWCIGDHVAKPVHESDLVDLYYTILDSTYATQIVTEYIITSAMKLTTRMSDAAQIERIRRLMTSRTADLNVEIQQRAVEYGNMFAYDTIRRGVLEKMPPPEIKEEQRVFGPAPTSSRDKRKAQLKDKTSKKAPRRPQTESEMLLLDLVAGGDPPAAGASTKTRSPPPSQSNTDSIMGLFGSSNGTAAAATPAAPAASGPTAHPVYNGDGLQVTIAVSRSAANTQAQAQARFRNTTNFDRFAGVGLQAAVPKSQKLTLQAINKAVLDAGDEATQAMKIVPATASGALPAKLRLRLKISYQKADGKPVTDQVDWTEP